MVAVVITEPMGVNPPWQSIANMVNGHPYKAGKGNLEHGIAWNELFIWPLRPEPEILYSRYNIPMEITDLPEQTLLEKFL